MLIVVESLGTFETWPPCVQQIKRTSILDHFYTKQPELINEIMPNDTEIGDHKWVTFKMAGQSSDPKTIYRCDWRNYNKDKLVNLLMQIHFNMRLDCVQETWNWFENELINVVDEIVPIVPFVNDTIKEPNRKSKTEKPNQYQKNDY